MIVNVADLRRAAKGRLPRAVFDYIDGGAEDEVTLRGNERAFEQITLRPRSGVATPTCDLRTTVLGQQLELPFLLAPIGSSRLFYPRGEVVAAAQAGAAGTAYILSTLSGCRMEDVRAATTSPAWYQLYLCGGHDVARAGIARAKAAGFSVLVVTIDTPVAGLREKDVRNGVKQLASGNLLAMLPYLPEILAHPRWLTGFLADGGLMKFPNVMLPNGPMPYVDVVAALSETVVAWKDFQWIRDAWGGPIVVKGVHTADDARCAVGAGADAVVAVLIGRAYAYGLGAAGGPGVARAIEILRTELVRTMTLMGVGSVRDLDASHVGTRMPAPPKPAPHSEPAKA